MKNFLLIVFFPLVLFSCKEDGVNPDDPTNGKAIFKVEYEQSGDPENFIKSLEVGDGFVYTGTTDEAPTTLLDADIVKDTYSFTSAEKMEEISIAVTALLEPFVPETSKITVKLKVYKDNVVIDEQTITTLASDVSSVNRFEYSVKD